MGRHHRRGFTKRDLLAVMVVIVVLLALLIPSLYEQRYQALVMTDGVLLRGINQSWLSFSR